MNNLIDYIDYKNDRCNISTIARGILKNYSTYVELINDKKYRIYVKNNTLTTTIRTDFGGVLKPHPKDADSSVVLTTMTIYRLILHSYDGHGFRFEDERYGDTRLYEVFWVLDQYLLYNDRVISNYNLNQQSQSSTSKSTGLGIDNERNKSLFFQEKKEEEFSVLDKYENLTPAKLYLTKAKGLYTVLEEMVTKNVLHVERARQGKVIHSDNVLGAALNIQKGRYYGGQN